MVVFKVPALDRVQKQGGGHPRDTDLSRLDVLLRVQSGRLRVADACTLVGLPRPQVFRLLRGLKQEGAPSLLSRRRGQPSNHRLPTEVRHSNVSDTHLSFC